MNTFAKYFFASCCIVLFSLKGTQVDGQIITTYAGNGYGAGFYSLIGGYAGDGGFATYAELFHPNFVAYHAGAVYIADYSNNVVRKVDASNIITTVAGTGMQGYSGDGGPATSAQLNGPASIAFDPTGNLYIAESGNNVVREVNTSGTITTVAGTGIAGYSGNGGPAISAQLSDPQSVSCDAAGNLYVSDENAVIRMVNSTGIISVVAGTGVSGFSGDGGLATSAQIGQAMQVAFDTAGNLYFCDWGNWRVRKIDAATGIITTIAGNGAAVTMGNGGPAIQAGLGNAAGITFDPVGDMYISNEWNNAVRRIDLSGTITAVAGTGATGYSGDGGPAIDATMDGPNSVCFDSAGNMYIADFWNNVVREVSICNSVTAGSIANNGNNVFCNEGALTLSLPGATAPGPYIYYQWASSTDGVNYTKIGADTDVYATGQLTTTTYFKAYVTCATSGKTDSTAIDTITIDHNPTQYDTICLGNPLTLAGNTGPNELNWQALPGGSPTSSLSCTDCSNPVATPTQTTNYVQVSSVGCNDTFAVLVLPVVRANFDTIICINDAAQLNIPADTLAGIIPHIMWSPASSLNNSTISNPVAVPTSNTSYQVTVGYTSQCSVIDTVNVFVSDLSKPLALDTGICQGVIAPVLHIIGDSLTWYTAHNTSGTLVQPPISTLLPAYDTFYIANRCGVAPVSVEIMGLPTVKLGDDTSVCSDVVLPLSPQAEYVTAFKWNTGDTVCCITADKSGAYTVEASNSCGVAADTQTIFFAPCSECLWVPTGFTPNNDGLNDVFRVQDRCGTAMSFHLVIVNRWGQVLYDSFNISEGWNGTFNGQPVPVGDYYYYLTAAYSLDGGKQVKWKGDVTVVR